MQHWLIFYLRAKKHHKISTKDLQKLFLSSGAYNLGGEN